MKKKIIRVLLAAGLFICILMLITSCKKEQPVTLSSDTGTTKSVWLDETQSGDSTTQDEEHTLPMITVA